MSIQKNNQLIKFSPKVGDRIKLETENKSYLPLERGAFIFTPNTGELFIDEIKPGSSDVSRIPICTEELVKSELVTNERGEQQLFIRKINFDEVANKMNKINVIPGEEGSIPVINNEGMLISSGKKIGDVGTGGIATCLELILHKENWDTVTKTQFLGIPEVTTESLVIVSPRQYKNRFKNEIYCSNQTNTGLEFTYIGSHPPQEDIALTIILYGKTSSELEKNNKIIKKVLLTSKGWQLHPEVGKKGYYQIASGEGVEIKKDSIITVSAIKPHLASPFNIFAEDILDTGEIKFCCEYKPNLDLEFYLLIENYV